MKNLQLANGDQMPILGLGTWKSESGVVYEVIREAIRIGYRHIDCAAIYGNEAEIGQAFSDAFAAGELKREQLWVTSKLWNDAHIEKDVRPALMKTLTDLQLDYLNLYLIHWPVVFKPNIGFPQSDDGYLSFDDVPTIETWRAMEACANEGLIRHIGVSNFSVQKLEQLLMECRIKPAMNQVELHPALQQDKLKKFCDANAIYVTAYSPLGSIDRPDVFKSDNDPTLTELDAIMEIAAEHNVSPVQILLAWAVNRGTAVIPKSVNSDRLQQNLSAAEIELSADEMEKIKSLDQHYRILSGATWGGPNTLENLWDE